MRQQWLAAAAQQNYADWAATEAGDPLHHAIAHADPGAKLLVCRLQPRCDTEGVAIGRIVEELAATEIADQGWSRIDANARHADRHTPFAPAFAEPLSSKSAKSIGLVKKSKAPRFIAVRMFAMSPYADTITVAR